MIPVVFSADHNFIMPTGVAIYSMLDSNRESAFDIFILQGDDVSDGDRKSLSDMLTGFSSRISFITPDDCFSKSYEIREISCACYFRLLIPWLIPQYDRVIYLDGDIIVKSDISSLLDLSDNSDIPVYGVRTPGFTLESEYSQHISSLGLKSNKYVNSGILVLNSKVMREMNLRDEILKYTDKQFLFQDQDILNIVCKDKIGWLPLKYNRAPSLEKKDRDRLYAANVTTPEEFEEALKNPVVIHYAGPKPWKTFTYHWYDWWSAYSKSPFYNIEFTDKVARDIMNPDFTLKQIIKMLFKKLLVRQ